MVEAFTRILTTPFSLVLAEVGDQEHSAQPSTGAWPRLSRLWPVLCSSESVAQPGENPKRRKGKAVPGDTPTAPPLPALLKVFSDGVLCQSGSSCLSPGWLCLAVVEGKWGLGFTFRSCFAVASALLSWACTSGSNKLKLAHHSEGRVKATDRAMEMTSSCGSHQQGLESSLV